MYEYAPWATDVLKRTLAISSKSLPILDLQFGGDCNLNCIYCDTERTGCHCLLDLSVIEKFISTGTIQWVYACGLGEPTAGVNAKVFKQVLSMCEKNSVKVSLFSNTVAFDDELLGFIDRGILYVLLKLDSFDPAVMEYLYRPGINGDFKIQNMITNYQKLKEVVHIKDGTTNLGASIVPTAKNYDDVYKIIEFCMDNNIYPLLGQLEKSGKATEVYEELYVGRKKLNRIRHYLFKRYGIDYEMPICPATISGIHITNTNRVIVDKRTGLSCGWFWLDEPEMIEIGNILDVSLEEITSKIIAYRKSKFADVLSITSNLKVYPFGGCGGNAHRLLHEYIGIAKYY